MSQSSLVKLNLAQNHPDFKLEPIIQQATLFKFQLLKKTLNPIQEDLTQPRTYTIKCLVKGCR
jgi:hypothetical protein